MPSEASADAPDVSRGQASRSVVSDLVADCLADIDRIAHEYLLEM